MNISHGLVCCLLLIPLTAIASDPPEISLEGLELVDKDHRGHLYADPNADWSIYNRINLQAASVAFRKNWQRDQNRYAPRKVKNDDVARIKSELAALFDEVFAQELSDNGGYEIVSENGDDVMTISPQIVDLDVFAPDTMTTGSSRSYTEQSGKMTLQLNIFDSVTGALIAQARDRKEAPRRGYMQWSNSVTNRADAKRMLTQWAKDLRKRLDEARASS